MKTLRVQKLTAVIPTASMADIAFLLIIFFMLTTSFSPVKMGVDLADAMSREEVDKDAAIIAIGPGGEMEISNGVNPGNRINSLDELDLFIQEVLVQDPTKQFIIKADRNIRYDVFNAVYEKLRNNNCRRIALLTQTVPAKASE
ncbi:MAG: Biopolymer transport protein ExbD/TolR [Acidobacteria bacterium]|jgi:biopolymer transport protein ExbD|nr:Biopolymer transport protein ExbD/TolR [Acidobacteriota bacterium]